MNTKEIKITVPEGYEIDKENSTFECIKFKKKGLTYDDVAEKLFKNKKTYFIGALANITDYTPEGNGAYLPIFKRGDKLRRETILDKIQDICITIICIILTLAGIGIIPLFIWGFTS